MPTNTGLKTFKTVEAAIAFIGARSEMERIWIYEVMQNNWAGSNILDMLEANEGEESDDTRAFSQFVSKYQNELGDLETLGVGTIIEVLLQEKRHTI